MTGRGPQLTSGQSTELARIISGGQTGVDRAALEVAMTMGMPVGGWCPRGRWAEDGVIPNRFPLQETPSEAPEQRTEWNVRDSDGTVIFSLAPALTGGSAYTRLMALRYCKPCLHLARARRSIEEAVAELTHFLRQNRIRVLNVAGPRASTEPEAASYAAAVLRRLLEKDLERSAEAGD
ncbi:MAG: putative molybdenum carrier protein [Verrucomicrobiota bacterium]|nr:putative molybdenum carrier protein [Limisphaera sp.]MDW8380930.1 putative molybdenum carrier protein [Verrucomicrobiota bacterium]